MSVFASNIPDSMSEDAIVELMQRSGRVVSIRMMVSQKRTAAPNTVVAFCDFADAISARSAVSALNGYTFANGTRMAVKLADRKRDRHASDEVDTRVRFVEGSSLGLAGDPIQVALSKLPVEDLYEAVEQLRLLSVERPAVARQLLANNPQLRYAVVLILQHAGRVPLQLPREAIFGEVAASHAAPTTAAEAAPSTGASATPANDMFAEAERAIAQLTQEELTKLLMLTDADFAGFPPAEGAHLRALQAELKKMLS